MIRVASIKPSTRNDKKTHWLIIREMLIMCSNMSRYHLSSTEQKLDHVRQQHKKMPSLLANIYGSPQVLINWNSVDGRCSQQLSPNWKLISNVSWQQEVPWCSKASVWRNFKDAFARHIKQKLGVFFVYLCGLTFLWGISRITLLHFQRLLLTGPPVSLWASALRKCVTAVCLIGHFKCFIYSFHAMFWNEFWHLSVLIHL